MQSIPPDMFGDLVYNHDASSSVLLTSVEEPVSPSPSIMRIGTWNVRGASNVETRHLVDSILFKNGVHVAAVQETNSAAKYSQSPNYKWYMSPNPSSTYRNGVAILVAKLPGFHVKTVKRISERIVCCLLQTPIGTLRFLSVHIPHIDEDSERAYIDLDSIIHTLSFLDLYGLVLMGDFNGHIGKDMFKDPVYRGSIGGCLYHMETNRGGHNLLEFIHRHDLKILTTFGKHSAIITRELGDQASQLDHLIASNDTVIFIKRIIGIPVPATLSDHKLIYADVVLKTPQPCSSSNVARSSSSARPKANASCNSRPRQRRWDVSLLRNPAISKSFCSVVHRERDKYPSILKWSDFVKILQTTCNEVFPKNPDIKPTTPRRRKALTDLTSTLVKRTEGLATNADVAAKRRLVRKEFDRAREQECSEFFKNLNNFSSLDRVKRTYKFIRQFRQSTNRPANRAFIPLSAWYDTLKESEGEDIPLIPEADFFPLLPPPTSLQIETIIHKMSNGKAPGIDGLTIELFKVLPTRLTGDLVTMLEFIWMNNEPPVDWQQTIQFPLPKIPKPLRPSDFRRITLTPIGYRVYSHFLLQLLDNMLEPLGDYQAAFLHNRSVDDHLYTLNRVLEEEWNSGNVLYVLSLDLEKAFDKVNLIAATTILKHLKVPHHLINRIIKACMWERTSLLWFNQLTPTTSKSTGVKQGCPLSPRLFTLVMDAVLQTMAEELNISLCQPGPNLIYPLVLAYADDILLISRFPHELESMLSHLVPLFESVGLRCNMNKSSLLIRDPLSTLLNIGETVTIGGYSFKVTDNLKYLGEYRDALTS